MSIIQHDHHLIPWLKAKFNITVKSNEYSIGYEWWLVYEGDYDLDIKYVTDGPTIYGAALEYCCCYNGILLDKLVDLEMGDNCANN